MRNKLCAIIDETNKYNKKIYKIFADDKEAEMYIKYKNLENCVVEPIVPETYQPKNTYVILYTCIDIEDENAELIDSPLKLNIYNFAGSYDDNRNNEMDTIFEKYGYYFELGNSWNFHLAKL